jgi:hypothetical protein
MSLDPASSFAVAAITEGVKFLYAQADEFLSAWRARRHDKDAPPPRALEAPEGVTVTRPRPVADPPSEETVQLLAQLKALVEPIQSGKIDPRSAAARAAVEQLRDVVEAALRAPIQFAGEPSRPLRISDIDVVANRVTGRVAGLRADLAKLPGGSEISGIGVEASDVQGDVTGVDLV